MTATGTSKTKWVGFRFYPEDVEALQRLCERLGQSLPTGLAVNRTEALRYAIRAALLAAPSGKKAKKP